MNMSFTSTQFAPTRRMGIFEPFHHMSMWEDAFRGDIMPSAGACMVTPPNDRADDKVKNHLHANKIHVSTVIELILLVIVVGIYI